MVAMRAIGVEIRSCPVLQTAVGVVQRSQRREPIQFSGGYRPVEETDVVPGAQLVIRYP
jgi:hypothetical protein